MKRKMFRKLMAASLATVMTVGLAGCGNNDTPASAENSTPESNEESSAEASSTEESSEEVGQYTVLTDENGNVYDLGGMEIIIRDWWSGDGTPEEPKNDYEEARQEYRDWIQETYNFTIKQMAISDWGSTPQDFVDYATTGGDENYVWVIREDPATSSALASGLMYDLATLDCLDFSEPKFTRNKLHEQYSKGDSIYCMYAGYSEGRTGVYFNKRLLQDAGIDPEEPYNLQASGQWTWDKLAEMFEKVQRDTDNDGVIDVAGFTVNNGVFTSAAIWSNGGAYVGKDENGNFTYRLEDPETLEALEWAAEMFTKYRQVDPEGAQWDYYKQGFINGEAAFLFEDAYAGYGEPNPGFLNGEEGMKDDFGFVMFPKGPKMDDYVNCWSNNPVAIPACYDADKAWKIAFAWNLYTDDVPGYEDWLDLSNVYSGMRDTRAVEETYKSMTEKGIIAYQGLVPNLNLGPDFTWGFGPGSVVSESVEAIRDTWKAYIDEANAK